MKKQITISLKMLSIMIVLLGILYPLSITGIAQLLFPEKSHGSLIEIDGTVRGSSLIGQQFDSDKYFNGRPSATNYNALPSGGSNLGMTSMKLKDLYISRLLNFQFQNQIEDNIQIPNDMLYASASGLDPHISPQAAMLQLNRIAKVRSLTDLEIQNLKKIIDMFTESPQLGIFGEPRINVFALNLELDKIK